MKNKIKSFFLVLVMPTIMIAGIGRMSDAKGTLGTTTYVRATGVMVDWFAGEGFLPVTFDYVADSYYVSSERHISQHSK